MCVPDIYISEDGRSFVVRKGGYDWVMLYNSDWGAWSATNDSIRPYTGKGNSIMDAVDSAMCKLKIKNA
jgi:hypothetical protein